MAGLFSTPKPPAPPPVVPMPDEESPEFEEVRRKQAAEMLSRGGRRSTILTRDDQSGDGRTYRRQTLGGS